MLECCVELRRVAGSGDNSLCVYHYERPLLLTVQFKNPFDAFYVCNVKTNYNRLEKRIFILVMDTGLMLLYFLGNGLS